MNFLWRGILVHLYLYLVVIGFILLFLLYGFLNAFLSFLLADLSNAWFLQVVGQNQATLLSSQVVDQISVVLHHNPHPCGPLAAPPFAFQVPVVPDACFSRPETIKILHIRFCTPPTLQMRDDGRSIDIHVCRISLLHNLKIQVFTPRQRMVLVSSSLSRPILAPNLSRQFYFFYLQFLTLFCYLFD